MNRHYLAATLLSLVWSALLYLMGAFCAAGWNITEWDPPGRCFLAFFWFVGVMALHVAAWEVRDGLKRRGQL